MRERRDVLFGVACLVPLFAACGLTNDQKNRSLTEADTLGSAGASTSSDRLLTIPQKTQNEIVIYPFADEGTTRLVDSEEFSRNLTLDVQVTYLPHDAEDCSLLIGSFVMESVEVIESIGSALSLKKANENLLHLKHEGPGEHRFEMKGRFVVDDPEQCPGFSIEDGSIAVTLKHNLVIKPLGSVELSFSDDCPDEKLVLSDATVQGLKIHLLDEEGDELIANNASSAQPVEILVKSSADSKMSFQEGSGVRSLRIKGESQDIELSSRDGVLGSFHLIEEAAVDEWTPKFGIRASRISDEINDITTGDTIELRFVGANLFPSVSLYSRETLLCSSSMSHSFSAVSSTPAICTMRDLPDSTIFLNDIGTLAGFGDCQFSFTMPRANQGSGLTHELAFRVDEAPF